MRPRCWLPRRRRQLEHNQCHGPFNFFPPEFQQRPLVNFSDLVISDLLYLHCHPERSEGPMQPVGSAANAGDCIGPSVRKERGPQDDMDYECCNVRFPTNPMRLLIITLLLATTAQAASYQYIRIGNPADVQTKPTPGVAMMGGGSDLDEA